jgi:dTDP-4-amino-4,6-dideoxygalactose transaminase
MITTDNSDLADRLRMLRVHGSRKKYQCELLGINSRLDALQAAILRVKFRHLDEWTSARRRNAEVYRTLFTELGLNEVFELPADLPNQKHVYNQFVIRSLQRNKLRDHLRNRGIPTEIYYPYPLHLQQAFAYLGYRAGDFPVAERACEEVLALPIFPKLTEDQQRNVVAAISEFVQR